MASSTRTGHGNLLQWGSARAAVALAAALVWLSLAGCEGGMPSVPARLLDGRASPAGLQQGPAAAAPTALVAVPLRELRSRGRDD